MVAGPAGVGGGVGAEVVALVLLVMVLGRGEGNKMDAGMRGIGKAEGQAE